MVKSICTLQIEVRFVTSITVLYKNWNPGICWKTWNL